MSFSESVYIDEESRRSVTNARNALRELFVDLQENTTQLNYGFEDKNDLKDVIDKLSYDALRLQMIVSRLITVHEDIKQNV